MSTSVKWQTFPLTTKYEIHNANYDKKQKCPTLKLHFYYKSMSRYACELFEDPVKLYLHVMGGQNHVELASFMIKKK